MLTPPLDGDKEYQHLIKTEKQSLGALPWQVWNHSVSSIHRENIPLMEQIPMLGWVWFALPFVWCIIFNVSKQAGSDWSRQWSLTFSFTSLLPPINILYYKVSHTAEYETAI